LFVLGQPDQALLEIREAGARLPAAPMPLLCWYLSTRTNAAAALRAAPRGKSRMEFLDYAARCGSVPASVLAGIDEVILEEDPSHPAARARRARRALATGDAATAVVDLRRLHRADPQDVNLAVTLAEALIARGDPAAAVQVLQAAEARATHPRPLVVLRARAHAAAGNGGAMRQSIDELRGLSTESGEALGQTLHLLGQLEGQLGNHGRARSAFEEAFRFHQVPAYLIGSAQASIRLGDRSAAYRAYTRLVSLEPDNAAFAAERDRLSRPETPP
jgi:predicted Zn-dependent protease